MPRPLRIIYPGAWYHIMNRGLGRRKIFLTDEHRQLFLDTLIETIERYEIEVHSYVLMGNHYHLLIKTPEGNVSRAMRNLNGVYTQRFNRLIKNDGPIFRGRYKSILVDDDGYQLYVSRYIHLNPVAAKLVVRGEDYFWSSYAAYLDESIKPDWLQTSIILEQIATRSSLRHIKDYKHYVEVEDLEEIQTFYSQKYTSPILGSKAFCEESLKKIDPCHANVSAHEIRRAKSKVSLEKLMEFFCNYFSISRAELIEAKRGQLNWPRQVLMHIARNHFGYPLATIAGIFPCIAPVTVSTTIQKCHLRLRASDKLRKEMEVIMAAIKSSNTQGDS
jgi:putative transposase